MRKQKLSVTYIYSRESEVAKYLEFLIDKIRKFEAIDFLPICLEEHKSAKATITKLTKQVEKITDGSRVKGAENYSKALDLNQEIERYKLALKYSTVSPAFILERNTEDEITILGTKKSLSMLLDGLTKITDIATFFEGFDLSRFDSMIREVGKVALTAITDKTPGEGLETTQKEN